MLFSLKLKTGRAAFACALVSVAAGMLLAAAQAPQAAYAQEPASPEAEQTLSAAGESESAPAASVDPEADSADASGSVRADTGKDAAGMPDSAREAQGGTGRDAVQAEGGADDHAGAGKAPAEDDAAQATPGEDEGHSEADAEAKAEEAKDAQTPAGDAGADTAAAENAVEGQDAGASAHSAAGTPQETDSGKGASSAQADSTRGQGTAVLAAAGLAAALSTQTSAPGGLVEASQASSATQQVKGAASSGASQVSVSTASAAHAAATVSTGTAKASTAKGGPRVLVDGHVYVFYSAVSGKSLEAYRGSTANKTPITQFTTNNMTPQQWRVSYDANNYVTFFNVKNGKVIDVANGKAVKGGKIWLFKYNGTLAQKWIVTKLSGGGYRIASAKNKAVVIDLYNGSRENDARVWLYKKNGTKAQRWSLYDVTAGRAELKAQLAKSRKMFSAGVYEMVSALSTNKVLDVANGSKDAGANVRLWTANKTPAQFWRLSFDAQGYAHFTNLKSTKALDVQNGRSDNCTNVRQWTKSSAAAQKWVFVAAGDGTYKIVSAVFPNVCLDVYGGSSAKGTNVQVYRSNKTKAQKWKLRAVTAIVSNGIYAAATRVNVKRVLDLSGAGAADSTKIQIWNANKSYAQKWYFKKVAANTYTIQSTESGKYLTTRANGSLYQHAKNSGTAQKAQRWVVDMYGGDYILKNVQTGKYLDLSAGADKNGATVQTWSWIGGAAQRWKLTGQAPVEAGTYFITSALSSAMVMGASRGGTSIQTNVSLTSQAYYGTQKWAVSRNSDGSYSIVNAASQLALDLQGASRNAGANIHLWTRNGSNAQKWRVSWREAGYFVMIPVVNTSMRADVVDGKAQNETNIRSWFANDSVAQGWRFAATTYNASMRGIDIASWEAGIDVENVDADFVIVKVSQGTTYTNPYWRDWADAVLRSGKKLGLYHYAAGDSPEAEADFFTSQVRDYVGKAVFVIDWENEQNSSYAENGEWWTRRWRTRVKGATGKTAWTYVSQSISRYYSGPLWIAQYPNYDVTGYVDTPWNEGAYSCVCRQYTSSGDVSGYSGLLDLNKFYGSESDWDAWAQGRSA